MKNKTTHYLLILDRSGSMCSCTHETISGYNEQVQMIRDLKQRHPDQEFFISLTLFNHMVEHPFASCLPEVLPELTVERYVPQGGTALLDAIGEGVMNLKARHGADIENDKASAVVVIITDGYENSSRIFNQAAVSRMIRELEATDKWLFSYLGSTRDAVEVAASMNIRSANAATFSKENITNTLSSLAADLNRYMHKKSTGVVQKDLMQEKPDKQNR